MMFGFRAPARVCVELKPGVYALGDLKYTTKDGRYCVHLDGECSEHIWDSCQVEFIENEEIN
jgi:hypothetical protein